MAASRTSPPPSGRVAVPPAAWWKALVALAVLNLALVLRATSVHSRRSAAAGRWRDGRHDAPRREGKDPGWADDDDEARGAGVARRERVSVSTPTVCLAGGGDDDRDADATAACGSEPRELGPDAAYSLPSQPGGDPSRSGSAREPPSNPTTVDDGDCGTAASYQDRGPPSTCNDVHALPIAGGDLYVPFVGAGGHHDVTYLTSGGFRSVYVVDFPPLPGEGSGDEEWGERAIMKTNRFNRDLNEKYLKKSQLDVIILGQAGGPVDYGSPGDDDGDDDDGDDESNQSGGSNRARGSNVLAVYQYCAFTSVSPFATAGTLEDYVSEFGGSLTPLEMYDLSLQAARGLAKSHLHRPDGVATFAHADVKPPQFLMFDRGEGKVPAVQLNDFNRGRLLGYDSKKGRACPFNMCGVKHNGSTYRSPEEYRDCADQDDKIDVYALGGVIYFIVTGGKRPWHYVSFKYATSRILDGDTSMYPGDKGYDDKYVGKRRGRDDDDDQSGGKGSGGGGKGRGGKRDRPDVGGDAVSDGRLDHPAVRALREVVAKCWTYRPEDRPSSLDVVKMLEDGLEKFR